MTRSIISVETISPPTTAKENEYQKEYMSVSIMNGMKPAIVVRVVIKIGLNLWDDTSHIKPNLRPEEIDNILEILSTRIIPLLTERPIRRINAAYPPRPKLILNR
jgi:hypothetical protein